MEKHCETCVCGRRAPVQASVIFKKGAGFVSWEEHCLAWSEYVNQYGKKQSAERMAERGGFSYQELTEYLGFEPKTWTPRV